MQILKRALEIVEKGLPILEKYKLLQFNPVLDYVDIFPISMEEHDSLIPELRALGEPVYKTGSGATYQLYESIPTEVGDLFLLKVRMFDPTKTEFLGHSDFAFEDYEAVKAHLITKPHVNMIIRPLL